MTTPKKQGQNIQALLPPITPRAFGYRMPAEWAPHRGTWLSWPHNEDTWATYLPSAERALADVVKWLCQGEEVHINVLNRRHRNHVASLLGTTDGEAHVHFHYFPTNDAWCRDHGAIFLTRPNQPGIAGIDWGYNAWGGKYPPFDLDDAIPGQMCDALGTPYFETPIVLEGGSVEVNGAGVLMTTSTCLLNPNRNPGLNKQDVAFVLKEMLGVDEILWLEGELAGDDTDGHIDNLARFVDETTIVVPEEANSNDENAESLSKNIELLNAWNESQGGRFEIVHLPMPAPFLLEGKRMPANYMNFYIGNSVVLMPAFGDPNDDVARSLLQACFNEREVVPIDCRSIIWGLGAIHCLTQQIPRSA